MTSWRALTLKLWPLLLLAIALGVFFSGLRIGYYSDDFLFVHDSHDLPIYGFFVQQGPTHNWYRPIQDAFSATLQRSFGLNTLPGHLIHIGIHALFCWLLFNVARRLGASPAGALLASLFMLLNQANAHAVLSNDTFSQLISSIGGCVSVWLLYNSIRPAGPDSPSRPRPVLHSYVMSLLALAVALLGKESGASFVPIIGLTLFVLYTDVARRRPDLVRMLVIGAPYLIISAIYLLVRSNIVTSQPAVGSDVYDFNLGLNVPMNIALLTFVQLLPISSVSVFTWLEAGNYALVAVGGLSAGLVALVLGYAIWRGPRRGQLLFLGLCGLLALFPMVLLNRVSELYAYNAAPFVAIIFGSGAAALLSAARRPVVRGALTVGLVALAVGCIVSIQHKAALMTSNGQRAALIAEQVAAFIDTAPADGQILLLNPEERVIEYSIYKMRGFQVLGGGGARRLRRIADRNDLLITIVDRPQLDTMLQRRPGLVLTMNPAGTQVFQVTDPLSLTTGPGR